MVAVGYTIVCAVCVFAAPTQLNYDGVNVPQGLSRPALDTWAAAHADEVICNFNYNGGARAERLAAERARAATVRRAVPRPVPSSRRRRGTITVPAHQTQAQIRAFAVAVANQDYADYRANFMVPSTSLMVDVGLWIALEATIGFIVGLGLASLMGQRTVPVILLIVLELILTPLFSRHIITHLLNVERGIVGVAMLHIEPGGLPTPFSGGGPGGGGGGRGHDADTGVHPGGVTGDRGLDRVLDRHRGLADDDPGRLTRACDGSADSESDRGEQPLALVPQARARLVVPGLAAHMTWLGTDPVHARLASPHPARWPGRCDVLAPRLGLISKGRTSRMPKPMNPARSPSMPKLLRTEPGCTALAVTPVPSSRSRQLAG